MILVKSQIKELIQKKQLVKNYLCLERQLTPQGFDLTVEEIFRFKAQGVLDFSNHQRLLPHTEIILPQREGREEWWVLEKGSYKIRTREIINLPASIAGIAFPRTSLLRMGVSLCNGVWDAGFQGRSEMLLLVENPFGVKLKKYARIVQLLFFKIKKTQEYQGIYRGL